MSTQKNIKLIKGFCPQCRAVCPTIAQVEDGVFTKLLPDMDHPNAFRPLCPKGHAGPELVYSKERLKYPMRRTRPKGEPDPGWERISWDEALDMVATNLNKIKAEYGAEAVAFYRPAPSGSPAKDFWDWMIRFSHAFGSPNTLATTHICNWARDINSGYTFGSGIGDAEADKSACILLWGFNPFSTVPTFAGIINKGLKNGAKLIVIDPKRTKTAEKAALWLQVHPGTDGVLALSILNVMIKEGFYDKEFVREWTNSPFLVRGDNGNVLKGNDLAADGDAGSFAVWDEINQSIGFIDPNTMAYNSDSVSPALTGTYVIKLADGRQVECKTVFQLLGEMASEWNPERAEQITKVPKHNIWLAAQMIGTLRPVSYWEWNGIEQQANTAQTNRAVSIIYALTGCYDATGGNRLYPRPKLNRVDGIEFLTPEVESKRLGAPERPLGPGGMETRLKPYRAIRANDLYEAILNERPYPVKGLVAFGGNIITANPDSLRGYHAVSKLDFFLQVELFMTPPAELADVVLPAASYWESWHVRPFFGLTAKSNTHIQLREPVVPPQHESRPDVQIMFDLARRLGLGDKFWNGDIEAGYNYQLEPLGLTVEELRRHPGGIALDIPTAEKAYARKNPKTGIPSGFNTPCKRIEIYSQVYKDYGYEPLPAYKEVVVSTLSDEELKNRYPLTLTNWKPYEYCHGWGRCLPSLRKLVPEPYLEVNQAKAEELDIKDGEMVTLETQNGSIQVKAKLTDAIPTDVVYAQHGWWQECQELGLPGYDPYSSEGRNVNLLYNDEIFDPVIGTYQMKGYPCAVKKIAVR